MLLSYFNEKQRKEKHISFSIAKEYESHELSSIYVFGFVSVSVFVFLLVFYITSFFRWLSAILLVRHFLYLNVTHAKIFVRYRIFVIVYFVTSSLANILNISCPLFHVNFFQLFFSNKITNRRIFKTN